MSVLEREFVYYGIKFCTGKRILVLRDQFLYWTGKLCRRRRGNPKGQAGRSKGAGGTIQRRRWGDPKAPARRSKGAVRVLLLLRAGARSAFSSRRFQQIHLFSHGCPRPWADLVGACISGTHLTIVHGAGKPIQTRWPGDPTAPAGRSKGTFPLVEKRCKSTNFKSEKKTHKT